MSAQSKKDRPARPQEGRESGLPGDGRGRRDEVGRTNVFPASHPEGASKDATFHGLKSWGQGERGEEGYEDHGDSEVWIPDAVLDEAKKEQDKSKK